ncbi:MAG: tripartite tricarboxylate transporter substrate binding protein [Burkholderiaceae bacterium]|nr:tripartite tricarboxylate transporter substrate binding protein [Burkholderiaceae bacterium]
MQRITFKTAAGLLAGLMALALASAAHADYPEKPISLIVPWAPGGGTDQTSRVLAKAAEARLGQPVVVLNKPGAAGFIGMTEVSRSRPDGYTIGTMSTSHVIAVPQAGRELPFDTARDFTYIMNYGDNLIGLVVPADSPWKTLDDLIAEGKKRRVTYGTAGVNSLQHVMMEALKQATGANFVHVPQQGSAASMPALLGKHVEFLMEVSVWAPFVESRQVRLLAVNTPVRAKAYPDVPTLKEKGFPSMRSMQAIVGPAGLPEPVRARLEAAFRQSLTDPAFAEAIRRLSMEVVDLSGAEVTQFVRTDAAQARDMLVKMSK